MTRTRRNWTEKAVTDELAGGCNPVTNVNVIALLIFAASFYLRTTSGTGLIGGSYTIPVALSLLGVILISISGYLGGELVFRHGVAVEIQSDTGREV